MSATIREVTNSDIPELAKLHAAFMEESLAIAPGVKRNPVFDAELALTRLAGRENALLLVAESAGAPSGFAFVEIRPATGQRRGVRSRLAGLVKRHLGRFPVFASARGGWLECLSTLTPARAWLAHLYVAPDFRKQGIAESLVHAAADWAKLQGVTSLELNVYAANASARRLYERLGMSASLVEYRMEL